jgi:sensor histidine kinase YesM
VEIEHIRFPGRVQYEEDVDSSCLNRRVPAFLLQPLVENAIVHGLDHGPVTVTVRVLLEAGRFRVSVEDDGLGLPEAKLAALLCDAPERAGVGMANTRLRLQALFGREASFTLENIKPGLRVSMSFPETGEGPMDVDVRRASTATAGGRRD